MIDWIFIGTLEGQSVLTGYVPDAGGSDSGVTIATGVDLGQLTVEELAAFNLPTPLWVRLLPYVGLRGAAAVNFLGLNPLTITREQSDLLDAADRQPVIGALRAYWSRAVRAGAPLFDALPDAPQTVVASVAFQYGPDLRRRCPRFWRDVTACDWRATIAELDNFGDAYPTRRKREAAYLADWLAAG